MGNILEFALGIETAEWIHGLTEGSEKLVEFLGVAEAGKFIIEQFNDVIKEGSGLFLKSFATGLSTGHLYQLGEAFKDVGLSAEEVEPISFRLQNALTGVNDAGQRTELAFLKLGLNMRTLRSLNPAQQILSVSDAFQKLDRNAQTGVAAIIFGSRGGAAPFLQLARQGKEFSEAFHGAAEDAASFQKLGGLFAQLTPIMEGELGSHLKAMLAEAAAGFIQPLLSGLNMISEFPWRKIGIEAGAIFNGVIEAFKGGTLSQLIADSIGTGLEIGSLYFEPLAMRFVIEFKNAFNILSAGLAEAFARPIAFLGARIDKEIELYKRQLAGIPILGKITGMSGYKGPTDSDIDKQTEAGINFFKSMVPEAFKGIFANTDKDRAENNKDFASVTKTASGLLADFANTYLKPPQINGPQSQDQPGSPNALMTPPIRNASQYEKLGFVLNTVASMSGDHARQTAQNTAAISAKMDKFIYLVESNGPGQNAALHHAP